MPNRKESRRRGRSLPAVILALATATTLAQPAHAQVAEYLDHEGFTRELRSVVNASDAASMRSLANSVEGREIWLVELALPGDLDPADRAALLVVGTLSGDHVVGSHLALEAIRHVTAAASTPEGRDLLSNHTIYVVPRANPDGAEAMFAPVKWDRTTNARPIDDDNDGRMNEDGPDDLNGDGMITLMRVLDPEGKFVVDPDEPRLMRRADAGAGQSGSYTLYIEGRDDDGDGFFNEDAAGGVDLDRNFQHVYPYYERTAGPHMVSEVESRALMDFVVAQRNIGAILTYGHHDNLVRAPDSGGRLTGVATSDMADFAQESFDGIGMVGVWSSRPENLAGAPPLRGTQAGRDNDPDSGRRPAEVINPRDRPYFSHVSERYREITGFTSLPLNREAEGAFFQYGYYQYGVPSFSTQGWDPGEGEGNSLDRRMLSLGAEFVDWTPVDHPQLEGVEVGGFAPWALTNPPPSRLPELGALQGEFVLALTAMLPRVQIVDTEVTALGGGLYSVEVMIENSGYFPSSLAQGQVAGSVHRVLAQIDVDVDRIITGDTKSARVAELAGSGNRHRFRWVVEGRDGENIGIRVRAQKGGIQSTTVTLR